jgi:hypothetical protein
MEKRNWVDMIFAPIALTLWIAEACLEVVTLVMAVALVMSPILLTILGIAAYIATN